NVKWLAGRGQGSRFWATHGSLQSSPIGFIAQGTASPSSPRRCLFWPSTPHRFSAAVATSREGHRSPRLGRMKFFGKTAGHLSGCPSLSPRAKNFWSLGCCFFELDKKEIGHQSPQS